ncbi:MAG: response regulator, partial [Nitrospirales bacterium]
ILLDIHMPVMNGRTMLDELRWLGYQIPVLAMSGGLDLPALRQLSTEGAQGFFLKPFNLQSLKQSCRQIFKNDGMSESFLQHFHSA